MVAKRLVLLAATISLMALWGCSSTESGGSDTYGSELQEEIFAEGYVGAALCVNCHQDPEVFDDPEFAARSLALTRGYLKGAHVIHSKSVNAGSGPYCLACHDPIGDGPLLQPYIKRSDVPAAGLAAVTCERCHGTGAETATEVGHWGIGPLPDPNPNYVVCGQCHNDELPDSHLEQHPEAGGIVEDYVSSPHAASGDRNETICVKCHTDEGGRLYRNIHTIEDLYTRTFPVPGGVSPIQCRTCHDPHNAGQLLLGEGEIDLEFSMETFAAAAEYSTCTTCHQPHNAAVFTDQEILDGGLGDTADGPNGDLIYHGKRWTRVLATTHYDDPATVNFIEGYTMDPENDRPCRDCHNVHAADISINMQWGQSGHAGQIITYKEDAATFNSADPVYRTYQDVYNVKTAGVNISQSWPRYNWDRTSERGSCQKCHTSTGVKNYLNGPYTYDLSGGGNDFSHLEGWTAQNGSGQNELLYCWGCHANNTGALRNAGKPLPLYDRNNEYFATIPDVGKATVCLACHGGRGNTETMINSVRSNRFQGHQPTRGALIFTDITHIAYEFAGLNYINPGYRHNTIGLNHDSPESGTGPCVGCHMPDENHNFAAAEYDADGTVIAVTNPSVCYNCHGIDADVLNLFRQGQDDAAVLLGDYVTNTRTNYLNINVNTNYATVPIDAYGAFQNWKYFADGDPCAYVHNPVYAKRMVFDSIDWLDNGVLDGVIIVPPGYGDAGPWLKADRNGVAKRI